MEYEEEPMIFTRLFPHSFSGKVKDLYLNQTTTVTTNWNELENKFINRFYPQSKVQDANNSRLLLKYNRIPLGESMALDDHKSEYNRGNTAKKVRLTKIQPIHS
ncbi:hypothetical protein MTR_3g081370 [Medicago truncatula]|uniref:Retrotransposon gag domain-containing protein n=1 Tax=Medicago truncatula TaxID=3880 RepID=A0A072UZE5_MEDTR|nr:hypothetical protein MTR_3g081370 [Medicago truncatula]